MIISLSGLTGSGKTLTMVMLAKKEGESKKIMTNINGLKFKHHRLKKADLFKKVIDDKKTNSRTIHYKTDVNWDFWIKNNRSSIFLDEAHNIIENRAFNSQENKAASRWVAQIRKVCEESGDYRRLEIIRKLSRFYFSKTIYDEIARHNNLYITSQTVDRLEKNFRDLSNVHIHCTCKHLSDGSMLVFNHFFFSSVFHSAITNFRDGLQKPKVGVFIANPYFDKYDRFMIVRSDDEYL